MKFLRLRVFIFVLLLLIVISSLGAYAAANFVPVTGLGVHEAAIGINDLKPPECAFLNLTTLYTNGPSRGGNGNDLILGTSGADNMDGRKGDDCIVGGGGNDTLVGEGNGNASSISVFLGGGGVDTCTGGKGNDRFKDCENCYGGGGSDIDLSGSCVGGIQ